MRSCGPHILGTEVTHVDAASRLFVRNCSVASEMCAGPNWNVVLFETIAGRIIGTLPTTHALDHFDRRAVSRHVPGELQRCRTLPIAMVLESPCISDVFGLPVAHAARPGCRISTPISMPVICLIFGHHRLPGVFAPRSHRETVNALTPTILPNWRCVSSALSLNSLIGDVFCIAAIYT